MPTLKDLLHQAEALQEGTKELLLSELRSRAKSRGAMLSLGEAKEMLQKILVRSEIADAGVSDKARGGG